MTEEQTKTENEGKPAPQSEDAKRVYERSSIEFPYSDLDDAVEIAKAIHQNAGMSCTTDQLAAYLHLTMSGGAFRGRVSNAATFRLTLNERGSVALTPIGRRITDSATETEARADAFLAVPLYQAIYEKYRGYSLPPPAALEREMGLLGVSSKQTDKARQAFMRSAKQAGFFTHGEDRLVKPSFGSAPTTKPIEPPPEDKPKDKPRGGGDPPDGLHPFIAGLLRSLPKPAFDEDGTPQTDWTASARVKWLQTAANIFDLIYKGEGGIEVRSAIAPRSPRPD